MNNPRQIAIHPSLTAPELTAGAERHLIWPFFTLVACVLYVGFLSWTGWLVGLLIGAGGYYGLTTLARIDPMWSKIYWRSLKYQSYYPAHTRTTQRSHNEVVR